MANTIKNIGILEEVRYQDGGKAIVNIVDGKWHGSVELIDDKGSRVEEFSKRLNS